MREGGPEAELLSKDARCGPAGEKELLRELNESLHEASQPMTVLLCTLEYGGSLNSMEEMRQMIALSQEACERLRITVQRMQARVREAIEEDRTAERVVG